MLKCFHPLYSSSESIGQRLQVLLPARFQDQFAFDRQAHSQQPRTRSYDCLEASKNYDKEPHAVLVIRYRIVIWFFYSRGRFALHIKFHALQAVVLAIFIGLVAVCPIWKSNTAVLADERMKPSATPMVIKPKGYSPHAITPESKKGEQYYNQAHCDACHSINDNGGIIGPVLDGIGQHRNSDFLYARLSDTPDAVATYARLTRQSPSGLTPHVRLAAQTASSLVAYLLTLPEPKGGFAIFGHKSVGAQEPPLLKPDFHANPTTARTEDGRKLYEKFGCAQCHQIQNAGGYLWAQRWTAKDSSVPPMR